MDNRKLAKHKGKSVITPIPNEPIAQKGKGIYYLIFLCIIIGLVGFIRYRLIAVPFERDEGEYAYIGRLFLHGIPPYKGAYSMKLPGTSFMYAVLMFIFGQTNTGVHAGLVLINALTMYFLFVGFKKIFNSFIGLTTATIYGFMALGLGYDAFAAHATHFICFFTSIAFMFLADFIKSNKMVKTFLFGLMLGMSFLMKQQAVFLILFGAVFLFIYLKTDKKQSFSDIIKNLLVYSVGVLIPYMIVVLIVLLTGQLHNFWLWTVEYASKYEGEKSISFVMEQLKHNFIRGWNDFYYLWLVALGGMLVLFFSPFKRLQKIFAIGYFIAALCAVSAGFYFRKHYFIVILPVVGLMSGIFIEFIIYQAKKFTRPFKKQNMALSILSVLISVTLFVNRNYFFRYSPTQVCNMAYMGNPFDVAPEISTYLNNNTKDSDKIAVLGSEPEIYFYAKRNAATGYLYTYPLVENQPYNETMQEQMMHEIEENKPAYLIFCNVSPSWLIQAGTPKTIFEWANSYTHEHYTTVGFVDFYSKSGWQFFLDDNMKYRSTLSHPESFIVVFKREPGDK